MELFESVIQILLLFGFIYHYVSYNKESKTPYHGIMAIICLIIILGGSIA